MKVRFIVMQNQNMQNRKKEFWGDKIIQPPREQCDEGYYGSDRCTSWCEII
mgnify:CR=1 FL=1